MKRIYLLLLLVVSIIESFAQINFPIDSASGQIVYKDVVSVDSTNKHDLFLRGNRWFANEFRSSQNVIQFSDSIAGIIIGKGATQVHFRFFGSSREIGVVDFTFELAVKDNKYKYNIKDLWHNCAVCQSPSPGDLRIDKSGMMFSRKAWDELREEANENILNMIKSLEKYMKDSSFEKSDW